MFNNYAIVQGCDHVVPVDIYLPGCPPRPEMLMDAILKLHDKIQNRSWASTASARSRTGAARLSRAAADTPGLPSRDCSAARRPVAAEQGAHE